MVIKNIYGVLINVSESSNLFTVTEYSLKILVMNRLAKYHRSRHSLQLSTYNTLGLRKKGSRSIIQ